LYNIVGNEITTLINDELSTAYHSIQWDGSSQPSGVYFVKIESGSFVQTKKMVLLKQHQAPPTFPVSACLHYHYDRQMERSFLFMG